MNARLALPALAMLFLTACASGPYSASRFDSDRDARVSCQRCGTVDRVALRASEALVVTAANDGGRKPATLADAIHGNATERKLRSDHYEIFVTLDDGRRVIVGQSYLDGIHVGARVYVSNGRARLL